MRRLNARSATAGAFVHTASLNDAKHPASIVAGPYGHPFHAASVVVPIGAWVCGAIFDVLALFQPDVAIYPIAARLLILIGLAGAIVAAGLGMFDWAIIPRGTRARSVATTHLIANVVVIGLFALSLAARLGSDSDSVSVPAFLLSFGGLLLLVVSGWLGGVLAHTYGIRVADERTQAEGLESSP